MGLKAFSEIWCLDFEFRAPDGERPDVRCMVAKEYHSGRIITLWRDELGWFPPFSCGHSTLLVVYYGSAEMGCFLSLGWDLPENLLDLYVEFKRKYNGCFLKAGAGLNGALIQHGLQAIPDKDEMRELAMREGDHYSAEEKTNLINYCSSDVESLVKLLSRMEKDIDWPRALLRGRYMQSVAVMEWNGIPIDASFLEMLRSKWNDIKEQLIHEIDKDYGVYEKGVFKADKFDHWLVQNHISWPRLESGKLDLKADTFREVARSHPELEPLKQLRHALSEMRLNKLAVGLDGRNRCLLSPFQSKTSRNQPSNTRFIFGLSAWLRALIKPKPGYGLAYLDWSQQEFAIAAVLSGDANMQAAYISGDPYLEFAKLAGAVPANGTKQSHPKERTLFKACILGVQYGMGPESLARRIGEPVVKGRELIQLHKETFPDYWKWSDAVVNYAVTGGMLHSAMGWSLAINGTANQRSLANWPVQTNGAEILRLAVILATEADIKVCCPVHDALLIESSIENLEEEIRTCQRVMKQAGEIILQGFTLRTDVDRVVYPERYMDERGKRMWEKIIKLCGVCKSE
jgi:hypothetical protein